jgi:sugar-specific transcriptional regulator TrmB
MNNQLIAHIEEAGLTEGEAKVYLALLKLGSTTSGSIIEESKVANSIVYRILDNLIEKGLVSFIIKEKTKYFQADDPNKIIEYLEEKKNKIDESKTNISQIIPQLISLGETNNNTLVRVYEGFKGVQTAYEHYYSKLKKGEEVVSWGVYPEQDEKYHIYWQKDHIRRKKFGIKSKILFNQGTSLEILKNRNLYWGCDSRYMPSKIKTPSWFMVYSDTSLITLQSGKGVSVEIVNKEIADSFRAYFDDLWDKSKPFK